MNVNTDVSMVVQNQIFQDFLYLEYLLHNQCSIYRNRAFVIHLDFFFSHIIVKIVKYLLDPAEYVAEVVVMAELVVQADRVDIAIVLVVQVVLLLAMQTEGERPRDHKFLLEGIFMINNFFFCDFILMNYI